MPSKIGIHFSDLLEINLTSLSIYRRIMKYFNLSVTKIVPKYLEFSSYLWKICRDEVNLDRR